MENVVLTVHLILALLLIGVVLLQRSEGGGLGMGGGNNGTMAARGGATALTKLTWILATAFIITSMTLTILATRGAESGSVVDSVGADAPAPAADAPATAPAAGGLSGADLLPPSAGEAPATPPRADEPAADGSTAPEPATNP
jgi:preprotein translocase subunit SecG